MTIALRLTPATEGPRGPERGRWMLAGFSVLLAVAAWGGTSGAATLAIVHGTVLDGSGRAPIENGVIVVEKGRIKAVGSEATVGLPQGAKVLDARGKFVIPGLMDANVHLFLNFDIDTLVRLRGHYDQVIEEAAQIALKSGLTTVFDTWGPYPDLRVVRERINTGAVIGSRIFFAGNIIGLDGPVSSDFHPEYIALIRKDIAANINWRFEQGVGRSLQWDSAAEVEKKIETYAARDVDFLKYASNGHVEMAMLSFSQPAQNAIVRAGHAAGKTVQSHVHSVEGIEAALNAGVDILTHCDITPNRVIPDSLIKRIAESGKYCSVMPVTKDYQNSSPKVFFQAVYLNSWENIKHLNAAGVPLMLSTDAGIAHPLPDKVPETPILDNRTALGEGHFNALLALEQLGVDPTTILKMATINIARGYKVDSSLGTIEPGKVADFLILDKNPLLSAKNYRSISVVIKDGVVIDRDNLPAAPVISNQKPVIKE